MVIGGRKFYTNDTLKVNTGILTDQLSNKTGIENLELGLNPVNLIDYTIDFTKLKDFKILNQETEVTILQFLLIILEV